MPTPPQRAREILKKYQTDYIKQLFAQSKASYILCEVGEPKENFPQFDVDLTNKVTLSAYSILAAGVSFAENQLLNDSTIPLEDAASLLINVHSSQADTNYASSFHVLIASMAFYVAGQYSRAFVYIKKAELLTPLAKIIASFIRKKVDNVIAETNPYLLEDLSKKDDPWWKLCDHATTLLVSRAVSLVQEFYATGSKEDLSNSVDNLETAMKLTSDFNSPSHWWIVRLFKLMIIRGSSSSLWTILPPYFEGDRDLLNKYITLHNFSPKVVSELWHSQLSAIPLVFDCKRSGAIVNMRTSAGKTRIAELAILHTLHSNPSAKILYLAPFRSLALEVEHTLSQVFEKCGFLVSHLYGGFRVSAADRQLAEESTITIATPEKARAILRASPDFFDSVKLIIIDEGHLIGEDSRYIKNELFIEHLKLLASSSKCRMLLLSAVLPNPEELALWLTGDGNNVAKSDWKPSAERLGILYWQGEKVHIKWKGDYPTFNQNFIIQAVPKRQYDHNQSRWKKRSSAFPKTKTEAVAASATRLATIGPVMIFSARANSIPGLAAAVLTALGEGVKDHNWPEREWSIFCAVCKEELQDGAIEFVAAQKGIICHSNRLPPQVRMAIEVLMRSTPPKIVIASTTLAQGVNIGVSSVIVATPYKTKQAISRRDFWNICGRAGRAFTDGEGKILYTIDKTEKNWKIKKHTALMEGYFAINQQESVNSGLLYAFEEMYHSAKNSGIEFEDLIEMVSENDFSKLGEVNAIRCHDLMELIGDTILALYESFEVNSNVEWDEVFVDRVFRNSLAAIQSKDESCSIDADKLIAILIAKAKQLIKLIPNSSQRKSYIASGMPISIASNIFKNLDLFIAQAQMLHAAGKNIQSILSFLEWLEEWSRSNAMSLIKNFPDKNEMDLVRKPWIVANPMRDIALLTASANIICKDVYGFQLPWLIHATSQQLKQNGYEELSKTLATVALLVELGVPSEKAAWIFLAGVRSRVASTEIASSSINIGTSINSIRCSLSSNEITEQLRSQSSENVKTWLDMHNCQFDEEKVDIPTFPRFTLNSDLFPDTNTIIVRSDNNKNIHLCSPDVRQKMAVEVSAKWPFDKIADDYRFAFVKANDGKFDLVIRDPRLNCLR